MRRPYIDFMGKRLWFFAFSAVIIAVGLVALFTKGLNFGIEFRGGTVMEFVGTSGVGVEDIRDALGEAGIESVGAAIIQPTDDGFIVRVTESDPQVAAQAFDATVRALDLPEQDTNVTTIGPGWGETVTDRALLALFISIGAILVYISIRFEYKMSLTAVAALVHDAAIVLGIYALSGREVTPNTFAALLTILGYSLYDTIVVFHRIRENSQRIVKQTFMQMANDSVNQVIARSINTSLTSLIPVITLFVFGGPTLRDFAFALFVGLLSGAYSSVGIAAPLYSMWKSTEPRYQALTKKYGKAS